MHSPTFNDPTTLSHAVASFACSLERALRSPCPGRTQALGNLAGLDAAAEAATRLRMDTLATAISEAVALCRSALESDMGIDPGTRSAALDALAMLHTMATEAATSHNADMTKFAAFSDVLEPTGDPCAPDATHPTVLPVAPDVSATGSATTHGALPDHAALPGPADAAEAATDSPALPVKFRRIDNAPRVPGQDADQSTTHSPQPMPPQLESAEPAVPVDPAGTRDTVPSHSQTPAKRFPRVDDEVPADEHGSASSGVFYTQSDVNVPRNDANTDDSLMNSPQHSDMSAEVPNGASLAQLNVDEDLQSAHNDGAATVAMPPSDRSIPCMGGDEGEPPESPAAAEPTCPSRSDSEDPAVDDAHPAVAERADEGAPAPIEPPEVQTGAIGEPEAVGEVDTEAAEHTIEDTSGDPPSSAPLLSPRSFNPDADETNPPEELEETSGDATGAAPLHSPRSFDADPDAGEPSPAEAEPTSPDPNVPLDPTGGMPDPNTPLDPTGGMPDPNTPLDPTGGMPDPNVPLDPTEGMPGPNMPLDPTGGMPDPNVPLDPTGGIPDPNVPLDPTGGMPGPSAKAGAASEEETDSWGSTPIIIEEDRAELLQFMVADVRNSVSEIEPIVAEAYEFTSRQDAGDRIVQLAQDMAKVSEFFEFRSFEKILSLLNDVGSGLGSVGDRQLDEVCIRLRAIGSLLDQYCSGLEVGMELSWPLTTMRRRIGTLLGGEMLHPDLVAWHRGDPERVLELDGVVDGVEELPTPPSEVDDGSAPAAAAGPVASGPQIESKANERTVASIRVAQPSVEAMVDIVRQLVLNKNQIEGLAEEARPDGLSRARSERLALRAAELSRLVKQLQETINKTCVQPISIVLDRYERMIRDVAQLKDKQIDFRVAGGDIEIDKFVLDAIAEPLGRLLRDTVSHAIEPSAERVEAGKPAQGLLKVETEDHESHIAIAISHDGKPLDAEAIRAEAATFENAPDTISSAPDSAVKLFPLASWYHTRETAGVADAFAAQRGSISAHEQDGLTTLRVTLPIAGAVIGVMNVQVGDSVYAIPVNAIREIVNLRTHPMQTVGGRPVLRLREMVYPVTSCAEQFGEGDGTAPGFAVIVNADQHAAALGVDRVIGHQEIVIEPVGLPEDQVGPFIGAAIRGNGQVCLVIDVRQIIEDTGAGSIGAGDQSANDQLSTAA